MKVIVAGGRDFTNVYLMHEHIEQLVQSGWVPDNITLMCGMARGADMLAWHLWKIAYRGMPVIEFPANWDKYGKSAGHRRNAEMAAVADKLIAFWDGQSRGTKNMIDTMQRLNKPVHIVRY